MSPTGTRRVVRGSALPLYAAVTGAAGLTAERARNRLARPHWLCLRQSTG